MARGRFISKEITIDKKVNSLSSAYSMLAFTWLLTHADGYGRTYGDPAVVKSIIFPRRQDVSIENIEEFIMEWKDVGLVNWYEVDDEMFIEFPNFSKHQVGLNMSKEAKSNIPPNPTNSGSPQEIPENSGNLPENFGGLPPEVKENKREVKGEYKENVPSPVQQLIESVIGIPPSNPSDLKALDEITLLNPSKGDIQEAYNWLTSQGKRVKYYSTLVGPIRTAMAKRVQKPMSTPLDRSKAAVLQAMAEMENEEVSSGIF